MALILAHANPPPEAYLGGLRALTAAISPALLERDRWGFLTLKECFGIDETSTLYCGARPEAVIQNIQAAGRRLVARGDDAFLYGTGYDFGAVPEPYKTELKAFFASRLARPLSRSQEWHYRTVRLIEFCTGLAASGSRPGPCLIDYGHPIEAGAGNGSSPLRAILEAWLADSHRMAEIGEKRLAHNEALLENLSTIITTITAEGSYRGDTRRYQRPACRSGGETPAQAPGR